MTNIRSLVSGWRGVVGFLSVLTAAASLNACGGDDPNTNAAANSCTPPEINAFKEMLIVDETVMTDARARNDVDGAWSFRYAIENMVPQGVDPSVFVMDWLRTWIDQTEFNGSQLDPTGERRDHTMDSIIICPWLKRTPANGCNEDCSTCTTKTLDLVKAPFRLIAIANRMDVREKLKPAGPSGEGRLLFGLTNGVGDDPAAPPLAMTAIFEYALTEKHTPLEWAQTWHALGSHASFDEAYKADLQNVTDQFVKRGAAPNRPNGSALAQLRTNESALNWIWQLRQFELDSATGMLHVAHTTDTPLAELNNSKALNDWVTSNGEAIKADKYSVPPSLLGGSANLFVFKWNLAPTIDDSVKKAFVQGTCNGCHAGDTIEGGQSFHISPARKGMEKVSLFLWDPDHKVSKTDELTRRIAVQQKLFCGQ